MSVNKELAKKVKKLALEIHDEHGVDVLHMTASELLDFKYPNLHSASLAVSIAEILEQENWSATTCAFFAAPTLFN